MDRQALRGLGVFAAAALPDRRGGQRFEHVVAVGQHAEDGVVGGQPRVRAVHDEPLAAVGVGAGVGHGQGAPGVGAGHFLVGEAVAGPAGAVAPGASALDHEPVDDPVELVVFVEPLARQEDEVVDGPRGDLRQQFDGHIALVGLDHGVIPLGPFDDQAGRVLILLGGHELSPVVVERISPADYTPPPAHDLSRCQRLDT